MQISTIVFLLLIFGYAQGSYYFAIWISIVCNKCPKTSRAEQANNGQNESQDEQAIGALNTEAIDRIDRVIANLDAHQPSSINPV